MLRVMNTVSLTLFLALAAVVPATLLVKVVPAVFNPGLQRVAVAAWLSALASWYVARAAIAHEQEAAREVTRKSSGVSTAAVTIGFLAVAVGIAAVLHFYGDRLLG